jgi:hypothetical protein
MKRLNSIFAIALSLIIGFGSMTAVAHSHADHLDSSCSVSVLQNSSAAVAAETSKIFVTQATAPATTDVNETVSNRTRGCQLARAPPYNL